MSHHRARFTPLGRWNVARYVIQDGETYARAAARADVSPSTVWGWVKRWRAASPEDQASLACLQERSSRPHRSPAQVGEREAAGICALREKTGWSPRRLADEPGVCRPHSTVHQVLRRGGCSRRPVAEKPAVVRYEWPCPGQLPRIGRTRLGPTFFGRMDRQNQQRVLAVASSGGHWVQLRRLSPAFDGLDVAYLTTDQGHRSDVGPARFYSVSDANRWSKLALVRSALSILWVLLRERPNVVVSTGAAPGYLAIRFARLFRARTVWIDSVANAEELSMSGRMASTVVDLCLTQWQHLAGGRVRYLGAVL